MATSAKKYLEEVLTLGFDRSKMTSRGVHVSCSKCEAYVVGAHGVTAACHQDGCPNQNYECCGCFERVSHEGAWCGECE